MAITLDFTGMSDSDFEKELNNSANRYVNKPTKGSVSLTEDHDDEEALMAKLAAVRAKKAHKAKEADHQVLHEMDTPVTRIMAMKDDDKKKLMVEVNKGSLQPFHSVEELMETVGSQHLLAELPDGKASRILATIDHIASKVEPKCQGLMNKRLRRHDEDELGGAGKFMDKFDKGGFFDARGMRI